MNLVNSRSVMMTVAALLLMAAPSAMGAVCVLKSTSGTCKLWSGSVDCEDLNATGVGNVTKDPKYLACDVQAPSGNTLVSGLVFCSNGGNNVAPGAQAFISGGFSGFATIFPSQVDRNGVARGVKVHAAVDQNGLRQLDQYCQNANWYAIDFVPVQMGVSVNLLDATNTVIDTTTFQCSLPNPLTLGWDKKAQKPERRQYNCTQN